MQYDYIAMLHQSEDKNFGAGATEEDIINAEERLGVKIPKEYVAFLREFGWGGVASWEIYGLGSDVPIYLDLVRTTQSERSEAFPPIPPHLLPLLNDGAGNHYCFDLKRCTHDRCAIVFWDHEAPVDQHPMEIAASFNRWMIDDLMNTYTYLEIPEG